MPMTKITLSVPLEIVAMAKEVASPHGTSVSALFASLVRALHQAIHASARPAFHPAVEAQVGCARSAWPDDMPYDEIIRQAIREKHGGAS